MIMEIMKMVQLFYKPRADIFTESEYDKNQNDEECADRNPGEYVIETDIQVSEDVPEAQKKAGPDELPENIEGQVSLERNLD